MIFSTKAQAELVSLINFLVCYFCNLTKKLTWQKIRTTPQENSSNLMARSASDFEFERAQASYEQNCTTFRSLNHLMWQIPLIAMTLTGGLWFGVAKVIDSPTFKIALLSLACLGNIGLAIVLHRLRFLMEEYLKWIENYNISGFVSGKGETFFTRSHMVKFVFQFLLLAAALASFALLGSVAVTDGWFDSKSDRSLRSLAYYERYATDLAENYESITFEEAHPEISAMFLHNDTVKNLKVLDIGTGSGRDAAWLALHSSEVVAVDSSNVMLTLAKSLHTLENIEWLVDSLPGLESVRTSGHRFDIILASAVWMHVHPDDRPAAMEILSSLLNPGGKIFLTLRLGPADKDRGIYSVSDDELKRLAEINKFSIEDLGVRPDLLRRSDIQWHTIELTKP